MGEAEFRWCGPKHSNAAHTFLSYLLSSAPHLNNTHQYSDLWYYRRQVSLELHTQGTRKLLKLSSVLLANFRSAEQATRLVSHPLVRLCFDNTSTPLGAGLQRLRVHSHLFDSYPTCCRPIDIATASACEPRSGNRVILLPLLRAPRET